MGKLSDDYLLFTMLGSLNYSLANEGGRGNYDYYWFRPASCEVDDLKNLLLRAVKSPSNRVYVIMLPPRPEAVGVLLENIGFCNYGGDVFGIDIELGFAVD